MAYQSVAEILESLDETRARLQKRVEGLSLAQEKFQPSPDAWSVAEIVEHLTIFEERMLRIFAMMVKKAESATAQAAGQSFRPVSLDQFWERSQREKYVAPETVRPSGNVTVADALARMRRARAELHELRPKLESRDLSIMTYPHPAFGPLDLYQWLALIGMHEDRHLNQIESVIASPEYK
ncbi:MAG: DinB family protein [Pyrinomonadaceae bacterium]